MRRKEKEIKDRSAIEEIVRQAPVCRLGLVDGDQPYVVPMNFGYRDGVLYVHGALQGRKMDILRKNQNVCVEFDIRTTLVPSENACDWGVRFQSVIAFGKAVVLEDTAEKQKALDIIMAHYSDRSYSYPENRLKATAVIKIVIDAMTGKQAGCSSPEELSGLF